MTALWIGTGILGLLLGGGEWYRPDRRHRGARTLLVLIAVLALGALLAPPLVPAPASAPGTVILATPGADAALLRAARDSFPAAPVTTWPDSVADVGALLRRFPATHRVVVVGWGMRAAWWEGQDSVEVRFMSSPAPAGFHTLGPPAPLHLGESGTLAGSVAGSSDSLLMVEGPDGQTDSLTLSPGDHGQFAVTVTPSAAGRIRYVLTAAGVPSETVSVAVHPPLTPAVLVVEAAPSFETTFLRRWLAAQGGRIAIRTRLSRDRDRVERVNVPDLPLRPLRPELLAQFDLLLVDGATLRELGPAERAALADAVGNHGMGLLVAPDSLAQRDREFFPFRLLPTGDLDLRSIRPRWLGQRDQSTTAVPALPLEVEPARGLVELLHDPVGRVVAAATRLGLGRIGTSVLVAPSRWQLEGDTRAYAAYWSRLYRATARGQGDRWETATDGPIMEQMALDIGLLTDDPAPVVAVLAPDGSVDTLGVAQDLADPARWWGRFWPRMPGWHEATNHGGRPYPFHVDAVRLSAWEAASRLHATTIRAALSPTAERPSPPRSRRSLPPLIPFVVMVAALGALWSEGRGLWDRALASRSH